MTVKKTAKTGFITLRVTRNTALRVTEAAKTAGVSRSEFIRNAALAAARILEAEADGVGVT